MDFLKSEPLAVNLRGARTSQKREQPHQDTGSEQLGNQNFKIFILKKLVGATYSIAQRSAVVG